VYVSKLGANLLSARHLCEAGLIGSFNSGTMYFMLNGTTIIKAKMANGLYIVNHVSVTADKGANNGRVTGHDWNHEWLLNKPTFKSISVLMVNLINSDSLTMKLHSVIVYLHSLTIKFAFSHYGFIVYLHSITIKVTFLRY
jgi:hypothetical protein